ncbi:hypothetical protein ACHAPO_006081 [Fusarium lateritium]
MPLRTFYPFPRLPFELRQQVWEEACLPSGPLERGIQYLDLTVNGLVPSPCNWSQTSKQDPSGLSNVSAYLIDGGLWNACKESREVIIKHTHFDEWVQLQNRAIDEGHAFNRYKAGWDSGKPAAHPATIEMKDTTGEWHMLAYPTRDVFCLNPDVSMSVPREIEDSLSIPFTRNPDEWLQSIPLDNIAFQFDQSWMVDCEMSYYDMKYEKSARGYWACLLDAALYRCEPRKSLWIIDKNAKWFEDSPNGDRVVYGDFEGGYVEVNWDDVLDSTGDGAPLSASAFVDKFFCANISELRQVFAGPGSLYPYCGYESDEEAHTFELKDRVRLLVRRENQVQKPTWRCWDKCDDQGWCICQDEEGKWWD